MARFVQIGIALLCMHFFDHRPLPHQAAPHASNALKPVNKLARAAEEIIDPNVVYTPAYVSIKYPNGDVPAHTGVCADVVIRAYRRLGIDLQVLIHEDMKNHFSEYPNHWGQRRTDRNIDHRRVPNLERFFSRQGASLAKKPLDTNYQPGDVVAWLIRGRLPHIGIVSSKLSANSHRYLVVHNVGAGQVAQDCLYQWPITGHYRWIP